MLPYRGADSAAMARRFFRRRKKTIAPTDPIPRIAPTIGIAMVSLRTEWAELSNELESSAIEGTATEGNANEGNAPSFWTGGVAVAIAVTVVVAIARDGEMIVVVVAVVEDENDVEELLEKKVVLLVDGVRVNDDIELFKVERTPELDEDELTATISF